MSFDISQDDNIGSLSQISLAPAYAISAFNPGADVTFVDGYSWTVIDFLEENAQLTEDVTDTDNGAQYDYTLLITWNKNNVGLLASLQPYLGILAIAKVTDNNGLTQIIGNAQSPISFKRNTDSGKAFTDVNYAAITGTVSQDTAAIVLS